MIYVVIITPWEVFKTLCISTAVVGFDNILFKDREKTFEFIQEKFNEKICLTDENS